MAALYQTWACDVKNTHDTTTMRVKLVILYMLLFASFSYAILLYLYYVVIAPRSTPFRLKRLIDEKKHNYNHPLSNITSGDQSNDVAPTSQPVFERQECPAMEQTPSDITTTDEFTKFNFQPDWINTKEFWDKTFETRYDTAKKDTSRPPLKVIIVPHSHNDPGWLYTFAEYLERNTIPILNVIISKMQVYRDMTFIWSEISFLQLWWDGASSDQQRALKQLIQEGRFEITTGGWVMTDEANVHVYAMVDQLIEGHQWCKNTLNYIPTTGWSVDPFGHGSTVPYLLSASGFNGTIINRIHYAWKQWLAKNQNGDFVWTPYWQALAAPDSHRGSLLTHNMPFDSYSIKRSCGPHPSICLNFDFSKLPSEYAWYSTRVAFITDANIQQKADLLIEQYSRSASLYPHNVALIPLGDDFRYYEDLEVEQQYTNYKKLIDYINQHKERYATEISFGLPRDYFAEIVKRQAKFPSLKGDFFVYSEVFTEGRPAYWSGYFTTRPMYKMLGRDLESNLRALEILFTVAYNRAVQTANLNALLIFRRNYQKLLSARRNLGLFQHHDAITGTSRANVMRDYGHRMFASIRDTVKLQESTIELLIQTPMINNHGFVLSELERDGFDKLPRKALMISGINRYFVVYNSLAQERLDVVTIRTNIPNVEVRDAYDQLMDIQINPVWQTGGGAGYASRISDIEFEVVFVTRLPALSLTLFSVIPTETYKTRVATVYCSDCKDETRKPFNVRSKQVGNIELENHHFQLLFDEQTGLLNTVIEKSVGKSTHCAIRFGAYRSVPKSSGAYLFKVDSWKMYEDVLEQYASDMRLFITTGPVASDVKVVYGPFLAHTVRIFHTKTALDRAFYVENDIDFEAPPKNSERDLYMRFVTDIENGVVPEFYSDQNSFQYQRRVKVPSIGVEGNYFPITSAAFIQDDRMRLTLMTTHAQGAASLETGQIEVMVDRRATYDDQRGMGEGVVDNRLTRQRYWVLMEQFESTASSRPWSNAEYQVPSSFANQLLNGLNYPVNIYFTDTPEVAMKRDVRLLNQSLPCDVHLMNLRTLTDASDPQLPSSSALMVLHRQGYSCRSMIADLERDSGCNEVVPPMEHIQVFRQLNISSMAGTLLTGLETHQSIDKFRHVQLEPMELRTLNITFAAG